MLVPVTVAFLWTAQRQLQRVLLEAGGERAQATADQLSELMSQNTTRGLGEIRRVAASPVLRRALRHDEGARAMATAILQALTAPGQPPVALVDTSGHVVLAVGPPDDRDAVPPPSFTTVSPGVGPFVAFHGAAAAAVAAEVVDDRGADGDDPQRLGLLVVTRRLSAAPNAGLISRLVGDGAEVAMGSGDVWTNFTELVEAPAIDRQARGVSRYQTAQGDARVGALSPVNGTPWAVIVDFPQAVLLAPGRGVLGTTSLVAVLFVVLAVGLVAAIAARAVSPLTALASASEAIAAGDYATRIPVIGRGEVVQVATAFNTMAARLEHTYGELEERVRARTEGLETAMRELDRFFSVSIDLFCIAGFDGRFRRVNDAWRNVLGWEREELTSRPYVDFVHPDDRTATSTQAGHLVAGQRVISFENRYRHKDGSYRWLRWVSVPAPEEGVIYASARDVTRELEIAEELKTRVAELADANQELESFSYSVSHDLRAPLRHITGFAALLERSAGQVLREQDQRYLQTITGAANRMGRLIDDLLSFSRTGRLALSTQRVSLGDIVEEARREVENDGAPGRAIDWVIRPVPEVDGDREMLRIVFVNLLANAVKYSSTRPEPRIEVGVCDARGRATVFVRDNGVGFDPQYAHKLFGVFQRLHSSDDFEGTGIGLATVRRIIRRHGGYVWAESALGQGATFYVAMPHLAPEGEPA